MGWTAANTSGPPPQRGSASLLSAWNGYSILWSLSLTVEVRSCHAHKVPRMASKPPSGYRAGVEATIRLSGQFAIGLSPPDNYARDSIAIYLDTNLRSTLCRSEPDVLSLLNEGSRSLRARR
jgi:hypothetical protein